MQFLVRTPVWVWPLLVALIWLGAMQLADRTVPRSRALILPAVMILLSISGTLSSFGLRADAFAAWAAGAAGAVAINHLLARWPRGLQLANADGDILVPGSSVPLLLILCIFCLRFVIGATLATNSQLAADPLFVAAVCGILGACSGLFFTRAIAMLQVKARPAV